MHINLLPYAVLWCVLAALVVVLVFYRKSVARHEDDCIHLEDATVAKQQVAVDRKLTSIDRWGMSVTALTVILGMLITAVYLYQGWNDVPKY